jgi:oligopeptide/dipeptide ABC transporter ATP-binding protein
VSEPLLEIEDLRVAIDSQRRGLVRAVDGVSLQVSAGETLALVGESGSGKTMTLRTIVDLLPRAAQITGGRIAFAGRDLRGLDKRELRRILGREIGFVFQEPMTALNPVMRVGEQIAEGPAFHRGLSRRDARRRALELMEMVGIPDPGRRMRAYPSELSGGLRQRVVIAMALACEPRLLLCDEPTTALDVTVQDQILRLLRRLQRETGVAVLFVTHDLGVVAETCERVAVMYAGTVMETGPVAEVLHEPRHAYTLGLLRALPRFEDGGRRLGAIPGSPPDPTAPPSGCRFNARCSLATEECRDGAPPPIELGERRTTWCVHHDVCADLAGQDPLVPAR